MEASNPVRRPYTYTTARSFRSKIPRIGNELGLGWYDYGARMYSPTVGRWNGVDALGEHPNQIDKSPYAYAWNNPTNLTDPDGNCPNCITGLIGAGAGIGVGLFTKYVLKKNISGKQIAAMGVGGFVAGATFGAGTGALATALGTSGFSGTVAATGTASGTLMAWGGIGAGYAMLGNLAEQGTRFLLEGNYKFDSEAFVKAGTVGVIDGMFAGGIDVVVGSIRQSYREAARQGMISEVQAGTSFQAYKEFRKSYIKIQRDLGSTQKRSELVREADKIWQSGEKASVVADQATFEYHYTVTTKDGQIDITTGIMTVGNATTAGTATDLVTLKK